ncbi:hypothetical protein ACFQL1_06145 [Halomicroarcula sp. GCM10025709]|uniref:hypothetical protein n=1 Tax=Haloarcula TaxID=2237 RepID=UPI0024C32DCE|nr:hypothetical protein [Halomicroarcula sp. YJ-61-S]
MEIAGLDLRTWARIGQAIWWLSALVGLSIVALAVAGYRRNRSTSMLFLGGGIATLTVVSFVTTLLAARLFSPALLSGIFPLLDGLTQLVGMCLILYAIVLARRE